MRLLLVIHGLLLLLALKGPAVADEKKILDGLLHDLEVKCETMEIWGTQDDGEHFSQYDISCRVPDPLKDLPKVPKADKLVEMAGKPDRRYAVLAATAALGRMGELTHPQRMRLALEVALRENEPFASAQIGFVFGEHPWWDQKYKVGPAGRNSGALGLLGGPWDKSQTAVIREYLFPALKHRKVSTLAVYLSKLMAEAGKLDAAIEKDLRKVIKLKPESFEAELAQAALKALSSGRSAPDPQPGR